MKSKMKQLDYGLSTVLIKTADCQTHRFDGTGATYYLMNYWFGYGHAQPYLKEKWEACIEALSDYRQNRENGEGKDSPSLDFPHDGTFSWDKSVDRSAWPKRIQYQAGTKDEEWMKERDCNYQHRLEQEGGSPEKEADEEPAQGLGIRP